MQGVSWQNDARCPPFAALRLITVAHHDFAGGVRQGELVAAATVADELVQIFAELWDAQFAIERMELVDAFAADDDAAMAANNTSAFNFRCIAGTQILSQHAFGLAIDINPLLNPMIVGEAIHPPAGAAFLDRDDVRPGMITRGGPVQRAFAARGWQWGGDWSPMKDYHHFAKPRP